MYLKYMYLYYEINYTCEIYMKLTFTYSITKTNIVFMRKS